MFEAQRTFKLHGKQIRRLDRLDVESHLQGTLLRAGYITEVPDEEPPVPRLTTMKKADLLALAEQLEVDIPDGARVTEIRNLLKERV